MTNQVPELSIIIPYLSQSKCMKICLDMVAKNTSCTYEVVTIVDWRDVYAAYNEGARTSVGRILVFLNDDMFVAPGWDEFLVAHSTQGVILTTYLVECGRINVNRRNIEKDFGRTPEEFRCQDFALFAESHGATVPEVMVGFGWYMPFAVLRADWIPFPHEREMLPSDTLLFGIFGSKGFRFRRVRSYAYHLQRMSDWSEDKSSFP